jgi:uncharacterized protein
MKLEYRSVKGLEIRDAPKESGYIGVLTGYAAVFNQPSEMMPGPKKPFREVVAPGAFTRSLKERPGVVALYGHDHPVARAPESMSLTEDQTGLLVSMNLMDTATSRDLLTEVRGGLLRGMSFGFKPVKVSWQSGKEFDLRTLHDVNLYEVTATPLPVYPGTSIAERAFTSEELTETELRELETERDQFLKGQTETPDDFTNLLRLRGRRLGFV